MFVYILIGAHIAPVTIFYIPTMLHQCSLTTFSSLIIFYSRSLLILDHLLLLLICHPLRLLFCCGEKKHEFLMVCS